MIGGRQGCLLVAALAFGAVGAALVSQHRFDMQPCPWCILQRMLFVVLGALALLAAAAPRFVARLALIPAALLAGLAGVAAALWQHFVAAESESCALTLADRIIAWTQLDGILPEIFQPRATCLEAKVSMLGMSYELWSLTAFVVLMLLLGLSRRTR